jgi:hypothetical protein
MTIRIWRFFKNTEKETLLKRRAGPRRLSKERF